MTDIVRCVETLRRLKDEFGSYLLYRRDEGENHGFIRPTPWDDSETMQETDRNIFLHRFFEDILPEHAPRSSYTTHRTLETGSGRSNQRQALPSAGVEPGLNGGRP